MCIVWVNNVYQPKKDYVFLWHETLVYYIIHYKEKSFVLLSLILFYACLVTLIKI